MAEPDKGPRRVKAPSPADLAARLETVSRQIRLPDDALAMRGGLLRRDDLLRAAEKARVELKRAGLTIYAADVNAPADLLDAKPLLHGHISFTTLGRLRAKGFEIEQTGDWPHHTAWFPEDDKEDDGFWVQMFQQAFDRPVPRTAVGARRAEQH